MVVKKSQKVTLGQDDFSVIYKGSCCDLSFSWSAKIITKSDTWPKLHFSENFEGPCGALCFHDRSRKSHKKWHLAKEHLVKIRGPMVRLVFFMIGQENHKKWHFAKDAFSEIYKGSCCDLSFSGRSRNHKKWHLAKMHFSEIYKRLMLRLVFSCVGQENHKKWPLSQRCILVNI